MTPSTVQVLLPILIDRPFDYQVPADLRCKIGDFVEIPFRGKKAVGVVWNLESTDYSGTVKEISRRLNVPPLTPENREFLVWVASYNLAPLGMVLKMMMPVPLEVKGKPRKPLSIETPQRHQDHGICLSEDQKQATVA